MLVLSSASAGSVAYWRRSAEHEMWLGQGSSLLGLEAPTVDPRALRGLLAGKSPEGAYLTPRPRQRRRQGWDLVFAAPKSVSLLACWDEAGAQSAARVAHRLAVRDAFSVLEASAACTFAGGQREAAKATVAAAFEHLHSNAGQPHLHTHVVLPNLALRPDGQWGCLVGAELWRWREGVGASFQLALRARLREAGLTVDWERGRSGAWEIAGLAHEVAAESSRSLASRAAAAWFGSRSAGARRVAQGQTRPKPAYSLNNAGTGGLVEAASRGLRAGTPLPPPSSDAVERVLAGRSSTFSPADVLVALCETSPGGLARHFDAQVTSAAIEGRQAHLAAVAPAIVRQELAALGHSGPFAASATHLACSGSAIEVLARAPWLVQAACLDAARAAWQAAGVTVAVCCPSEDAERRWRALTSLRPANGPFGQPGKRVLVVDAADHLGPAKLARLVSQAGSTGTKLVLVPGGTARPLPQSMAECLDEILATCPTPCPLGAGLPTSATNPEVSVPGFVAHGALSGHDAIAHTVSAWLAASATGKPALMVGLGPEEAEALNAAARARIGLLGSPGEVCLGHRRFAPGDRVIALSRMGPVRPATWGTVTRTDDGLPAVSWEGLSGTVTITRAQARCLGHGYATTAPYLRGRAPGTSTFCLGGPYSVPGVHPSAAWVTVAGPGVPAPGFRSRWRRAVTELAVSWPDEQILAKVGPKPLHEAARARWAELAGAQALERALGVGLQVAAGRGRGPALSL